MSIDYYIVDFNKKARLWISCNCKTSDLKGIGLYKFNEPKPLDLIAFKNSYKQIFKEDISEDVLEKEVNAILAFCSDHDVLLVGDYEMPDEILAFTKFDLKRDGTIQWLEWNDEVLWYQ